MQVIDIITDALIDIGALAPGESIEAVISSFAFRKLNDLIDQWSNEKLMVYYITEIIQTIAGATAWTIGPSGQINVPRPLRINSAFVRVATLDYPVAIIDVNAYEMIGLKQLNGPWPRALYYQPTEPIGVINFWPLPSSGEIHMFADTVFTSFATINDAIILPQGFSAALKWNLAEKLLPGFGKKDPASIQMIMENAAQGKALIKRTNMQPQQVARFDGLITKRNSADAGWILNGGFV